MNITAFFDGLCEPKNPGGIGTYGYVIYEGNIPVIKDKGIAGEPFSPSVSNNTAEFTGVIMLMEALSPYTKDFIMVYGDSQFVINVVNERNLVRSPRIRDFASKALQLKKNFSNIQFGWIPRAKNMEADKLTEEAYHEYVENHPIDEKYRKHLATPKQKAFMEKLGIEYDDLMSKTDASRFISRELDNQRRGFHGERRTIQ